MLCEICRQREATVHETNVVGDAVTTQDVCRECFEIAEPSEARELMGVFSAGCHYCGGEPHCTCPDLTGDAEKLWTLCANCAQEFYRFMDVKLPGLSEGKVEPEVALQVPMILAELDRHMKQWVSDRHSPGDGP